MTALRLELEITAVDPSGDMVYVEGRGPGGVQVGLLVAAGSLPVRAGQRLAVSIEVVAPAAAPSMRERMVKSGAAVAELPRSAATASRAAVGTPAPSATDVVLSAIFGSPPSVERERSVEDEMDALLGRRKEAGR